MTDYERGWHDGVVDATILLHPINTGPHTYSEYLRIRDSMYSNYYAMPPNEYSRGYADGADSMAETANLHTETEDD